MSMGGEPGRRATTSQLVRSGSQGGPAWCAAVAEKSQKMCEDPPAPTPAVVSPRTPPGGQASPLHLPEGILYFRLSKRKAGAVLVGPAGGAFIG